MPTTERLQVSDSFTSDIIDHIASVLNAASELGVYTNDYQPEPEDELADLTEPVHGEYARVDLTGLWQGPFLDEPGVHTVQTQIYEFSPPTSGGDVTIYGWFVAFDDVLAFAFKLETPFVLTVGGDPFRVRAYYSQYSGLIHAERVCT